MVLLKNCMYVVYRKQNWNVVPWYPNPQVDLLYHINFSNIFQKDYCEQWYGKLGCPGCRLCKVACTVSTKRKVFPLYRNILSHLLYLWQKQSASKVNLIITLLTFANYYYILLFELDWIVSLFTVIKYSVKVRALSPLFHLTIFVGFTKVWKPYLSFVPALKILYLKSALPITSLMLYLT